MPAAYPNPNSNGSVTEQHYAALRVNTVLVIQKATWKILLMNRTWPRPFSPGFKPPCPSFTSISVLCGAVLSTTEHSLGFVKKHEPSDFMPEPRAGCCCLWHRAWYSTSHSYSSSHPLHLQMTRFHHQAQKGFRAREPQLQMAYRPQFLKYIPQNK